jgi:ATP-dependent DNA helicase DinG
MLLADVFALLSERLPQYENRPQQQELAKLIERAFETGRVGVFEAGTGTGKSLSALIPAVLSGKKVVVSTATIALQEQYINKDIPTLSQILPIEINAALMKGRGNYIGLRRFEEYILEQEINNNIFTWVDATETGDISELDFPVAGDVWGEINSDADDCLRNRCHRFNECFYFKAKQIAQDADILIVNHALLLADAASLGNILPPYDLLIIDEAHQLPEIATNAFSVSLSNRGVSIVASKALKNSGAPVHLVHNVEEYGLLFFDKVTQACKFGKTRIRKQIEGTAELRSALIALKDWLAGQDFETILDVDNAREKAKLKAKALVSTIDGYVQCLDLLESQDQNWVLWAEKFDSRGVRAEIVAAPLDVSSFIEDLVFNKPGLTSSILMSATLATSGEDPFAFFKKQVGCPQGVIQAKVDSPFDYPKQAVLYLPSNLFEPNTPEFIGQAAEEIEKLLYLSKGRAFALFTSYSAMNTIYDLLKDRLPFAAKKQGEMSRKKLIEWFCSTDDAVLFGTASFWQGVSIDGEQLSCVIIDRIPFQAPDDPVYEARCDALKQDVSASWFNDLALPYAIMRLKQGVGRLIRTRTDTGIVAILDSRISKKSYGRSIIQCLPPMTILKSLSGVKSLEELIVGK